MQRSQSWPSMDKARLRAGDGAITKADGGVAVCMANQGSAGLDRSRPSCPGKRARSARRRSAALTARSIASAGASACRSTPTSASTSASACASVPTISIPISSLLRSWTGRDVRLSRPSCNTPAKLCHRGVPGCLATPLRGRGTALPNFYALAPNLPAQRYETSPSMLLQPFWNAQ